METESDLLKTNMIPYVSDLHNSAMVIKLLVKVDIFTASLFHCQFAMFFRGNNTFSILTLRFA